MTRTEFQLDRAELLFLQHEQTRAAGAGIRHECFLTLRAEITIADLQAERAIPATDLLLHGFQAGFDAAIGEARGRRAAFQFGVFVVGVAGAQIDVLQERSRVVDAGLHVEAVLHHVDADIVLAFFFLSAVVVIVVMTMIVIGMHVRAIGNAVVGAIGAGRHAEVTAFAQPGRAQATCARAHGAVVQPAATRFVGIGVVMVVSIVIFQTVDHCITGNAVVIAVAHQAIDMQHPVSVDAIQAEHAAALVVDRVAAQLGTTTEWTVWNLAGDAAIDHIHRATDGAAAEQQCRRALQYFDLVSQEWLDAGGVVGTDGGGVHVADAIGEHLHARAFLSTDDRSADTGAEEGALHAGQLGDGVAERAGFLFVQPFTGQHLHRVRKRFGWTLQWRGRDLDRRQLGQVMALSGIIVIRCHGNAGQGGSQCDEKKMTVEMTGQCMHLKSVLVVTMYHVVGVLDR
ncbi:hypothetical protein D3C81_697060 [compost metagenome]